MGEKIDRLPRAFVWRRLHSLTGLWFVLFLIEHLITNSQAALLLGESGQGFVRTVNLLHNLPYLNVIEIGLLAIPFGIHAIWGVRYALTAKANSMAGGGRRPQLKYGANRAYTWQRITSWILLVLLLVHVVKFRFVQYPVSVNEGTPRSAHLVLLKMDGGLYTLANRLGVDLYDRTKVDVAREEIEEEEHPLMRAAKQIQQRGESYSVQHEQILASAEKLEEKQALFRALARFHPKPEQVVAVAPTFGTASLLNVRSTFQNPIWVGVYTIFVLSACFHAFNGLWTSMLTWGWVVKVSAQQLAKRGTIALMLVLTALGLLAVWGTYIWNLTH